MSGLAFDEVQPDKTHNWVNLTTNDFETLMLLASKETKAAKTAEKERAIFKLFSNGINTARDGWVTDESSGVLAEKVSFFIEQYNKHGQSEKTHEAIIKWSRNLKVKLVRGEREPFKKSQIVPYAYRPYFNNFLYQSELMIDELGQLPAMCRGDNWLIAMPAAGDFRCLATDRACDFHFIGDSRVLSLYRYDEAGARQDNITDWAVKQFAAHYADEIGKGKSSRKITKEAIFHYCYAVLHDPLYREKYAQNLKREFPRIPYYKDFWQWAAWGEQLMALHIGYEAVEPFALSRTDQPDAKARAAGLQPKALLRADAAAGSITLDTETTLRGIPPAAWTYKLGNRCAIDWVLDQYKEKKPKDPTIREKFDTYRFADYKEKVIDLLMRVTTVSVETVRIVEAMKVIDR
jgi:predicted helicase